MNSLLIIAHPGYMWRWGEDHEQNPTLGRPSWDDANRQEDATIEALEGLDFEPERRGAVWTG